MNFSEIQALVKRIGTALQQQADPKRAEGEKRYFKETINPRGVTLPKVRAIEKELWKELKAELELDDALKLTELLFETGYWEEPVIGMGFVNRFSDEFSEKELERFEQWLDCYINNWAHCDDLCNHSVGALLEKKPGLARKLVDWTQSGNRWKRRAAAVSFILPARKGLFEQEILAIAEKLFADKKDDLVQKGNGWMLREFGKPKEEKLVSFLRKHQQEIPRTTMRYAIERLPTKVKKGL
jgi:3-methyladenine DNA glycosylase AlkD